MSNTIEDKAQEIYANFILYAQVQKCTNFVDSLNAARFEGFIVGAVNTAEPDESQAAVLFSRVWELVYGELPSVINKWDYE